MAATAQQQLDAANDSLLRILETDTSQWSKEGHAQQQLDIEKLERTIARLESKIAGSGGRRIFGPVRRCDY